MSGVPVNQETTMSNQFLSFIVRLLLTTGLLLIGGVALLRALGA